MMEISRSSGERETQFEYSTSLREGTNVADLKTHGNALSRQR